MMMRERRGRVLDTRIVRTSWKAGESRTEPPPPASCEWKRENQVYRSSCIQTYLPGLFGVALAAGNVLYFYLYFVFCIIIIMEQLIQ